MGKIIGITGGISSGKSTVTNFLRHRGFQVVDADALVHQLQAPGGRLYNILVEHFGNQVVLKNGQLNRPLLASLIFSNPKEQEWSKETQGQVILEELASLRNRLAKTEKLFFMDIPLLFELSYENWFDQIWLVDVTEETQLKRLMSRNALSQEEAEKRITAQLSLNGKRNRVNLIIDNNGLQEATYQQLRDAIQKLERR